MNGHRVFAMILAAGQSRRMGRPKQMLPYGEGTVLEAVTSAVLESSADGLVIVTNPEIGTLLADELPDRCCVAINHDADSEMLTSVQIGLRCVMAEFAPLPRDGVMILLGDQPQVTGGTITTLAETYRLPRKPPGILVATYGGRRGHPAIFSVEMLAEIEQWPDDLGLNELARRHPDAVRELAITTCPMPIDVNTPEDYERLRGSG
ncbi:MAG: nucleotidyltransferase family protein [Phycisphaerae bacterium]|nr:nucleotidyltransferase family protein [Phycisphaerae bacterium]